MAFMNSTVESKGGCRGLVFQRSPVFPEKKYFYGTGTQEADGCPRRRLKFIEKDRLSHVKAAPQLLMLTDDS